ncbi:MAG: hypothetical protein ACTTJ2_06555 [Anaerovoracaceae bacterium]
MGEKFACLNCAETDEQSETGNAEQFRTAERGQARTEERVRKQERSPSPFFGLRE